MIVSVPFSRIKPEARSAASLAATPERLLTAAYHFGSGLEAAALGSWLLMVRWSNILPHRARITLWSRPSHEASAGVGLSRRASTLR